MIKTMSPESQGFYSHWLEMMRSIALGQWRLLGAQYQGSLDLLQSLTEAKETEARPDRGPEETSAPPGGLRELEARALERVRKGFPPPPEVYEAQNRGRIDWSRFPEWAWPTDPELFTGTAHEG